MKLPGQDRNKEHFEVSSTEQFQINPKAQSSQNVDRLEHLPSSGIPKIRDYNKINGPSIKPRMLKNLFFVWIMFSALNLIYKFFTVFVPNNTSLIVFNYIGSVISLSAVIMSYILLYCFWQIIQDGHARITPGRAIGFLFIPIFNIYWFFRIFLVLSLDQNRYITEQYIDKPDVTVHKANPIIARAYFIFTILGCIVLSIIPVRKTDGMISTNKVALILTPSMSHVTTPWVIFSFVVLLLNLWMFFDFYKTAISICEAEEKTPKPGMGES